MSVEVMDPPTYILHPPSREDDELPNYTDIFSDTILPTPTAAPPRERITHVFGVRDKTDGPEWLQLHITSRAMRLEQLPIYCQGDTVAGSVHIDLKKATFVKSVSIFLTGDIVLDGRAGSKTFLKISQVLWSAPDKGRTRANSSGHTLSHRTGEQPPSVSMTRDDKLVGQYSWSFALDIPNTVLLKAEKTWKPFNLPASLLERDTKVTIIYRLLATVARGKLQPASSVDTTINYIPRIEPSPPSALRQLAYQERQPLLEPSADPEGWHSLSPIVVMGTLFGSRDVQFKCELSLAKPLIYTRGSVIPLYLSLQAPDSQMLGVLSADRTARVCLYRKITVIEKGITPPASSYIPQKPVILKKMGDAIWWPSPFHTTSTPSSVLFLQGEIILPKELTPDANIGRYEVAYQVVFLPFESSGFVPAQPAGVILQEIPVKIATVFCPGPRPVSYAPSTQTTDSRVTPASEVRHDLSPRFNRARVV